MENISRSISALFNVKTLLVDSLGILFILFVPAISHLTALPVYFLEPMRVMIVVALIYTAAQNAYLIALALPLLSFLVSGHPFPGKMAIIMAELALNVWLYLNVFKVSQRPFFSMLLAIAGSKVICYLLYWVFFSWAFVIAEAEMKFLIVQVVVSLLLSFVTWLLIARQKPAGTKIFY
jgi:hypothetical protein